VENKAMVKGRGIYKNLNPNDIETKAFSYSKELESEADLLGLELYKKSNYSFEAAEKVFDVLLYSYLPFDEVEFSRDYFNDKNYEIPQEYFLETVNAITAVDNYDDEKNTHPNIKKRRAAMREALKDEGDSERKLYVVSENEFNRIRKICRFEACLLHLNNCDFEEAFYNAYLLQQKDPNNIFLKKIINRSLYGASMYKNHDHSTNHSVYYKDVEGESQQIYYLFNKLPSKDFNVLALRYAYITLLADSNDATTKKICTALTNEMVAKHDLGVDDFRNTYVAMVPDSIKNKPDEQKTKVEKIKTFESDKNIQTAYWRYAFVDYLSDSGFKKLFSDASIEFNKKNSLAEPKKKNGHQDFAIGIKKVVIVNPLYLIVDETSKDPLKFEAAEELKLDLQSQINSCSDAVGLQIEYLETMILDETNTAKFNDLAILNNWISEELDHEDVPVINSNNKEMMSLIHKYNTDHFAWIGVINFHEKKQYVVGKLILSAIYFPVLPFTIAWAVKPKYNTVIFTMVANGETGEFEMEYANSIKANDVTSIKKSNLYYIFQQMKKDSAAK
ncbi:MAG: hypothetical protein LH473_08205, partial [Chitinophagales bacterium]|nr:hypothetical protein [Chitinophagales bacterium]